MDFNTNAGQVIVNKIKLNIVQILYYTSSLIIRYQNNKHDKLKFTIKM